MEACRLVATDLACRRGERLLFRGVSLRLGAGSALQVTGANGIGKSSLLRILAGLLRPFAGEVTRQGSVALLDERPALDEHRPLGQALKFWTRIDAGEGAPLALMGLAELGEVPVRYLSTGQRKRAAIARMMGQQAPIWLLDEPLNGLDSAAAAWFEGLVEQHCQRGGIAIIASHQKFALAGLASLPLSQFQAARVE